jgi:hypothetical protein
MPLPRGKPSFVLRRTIAQLLVYLTRFSPSLFHHPRSSACIRGYFLFFFAAIGVHWCSFVANLRRFGCGYAAPGSLVFICGYFIVFVVLRALRALCVYAFWLRPRRCFAALM